jgi:signal transduction histidine kinase/sugar lactone lactonase YvrE
MPARFFSLALLVFLIAGSPASSLSQMNRIYDGWRWVQFGTESGLPSERVLKVLETPRGEVWAQTTRGLAWFDEFQWHYVDIPGVTFSRQAMQGFALDSSGLLLFNSGQVYHIDRDTVQLIELRSNNQPVRLLGGQWTKGGRIFQTDSLLFREAGGTLRPIPSPYEKLLIPDGQQRYLVGGIRFTRQSTLMNGGGVLYRYRGDQWTPVISSPIDYLRVIHFEENDKGAGAAVVETRIDEQGVYFWQPGEAVRPHSREKGDGIISLDVSPDGETLMLLTSGELRLHARGDVQTLPPFPSPVNYPRYIRFRRNGDLWVCTPRGLFLCRLKSGRWSTWKTGTTLAGNIVSSISRARDGSFWVGTREGLYVRSSDGGTRVIRSIGKQAIGRVTTITEDRDGNMWIGSGSSFSGAYRWNGKTWRHFGPADGLDVPLVHKIVLTRNGKLWFLGMAAGPIPTHPSPEPGAICYEGGIFSRIGPADGLLDGRVYAMVEDRDGALWFGTLTGLSKLSHGKWQYWKAGKDFRHHAIFTLAVDSTNRVWFGQRWDGLRYIDSTGRVRSYTVEDGLVSNLVWDLHVDPEGRLWIGTMEGIGSYDGVAWMNFEVSSGLANGEVWPILYADRHVYAGTQGGGVSVLNIDQISEVPPSLTLKSPLVDERRVTLSWSANASWADIPPGEIRTRYRLQDSSWSAWGPARTVTFNHLDAGTYRFDVELHPASRKGPARIESASFSIQPPLYLRPSVAIPLVFLGILVLALAAGIWERKRRFDRAVRESEARFRAQYRSNPIATFTWKHNGKDIYLADANDAAVALSLGHVTPWLGKPLHEILQQRPQISEPIERCLAGRSVVREEMQYSFMAEPRTADFVVIHSYVPPDMVLTHVEDVTEQKRAEAKIRDSREQLRALAARLESVREEERTQLSREIHDELGQLMTGLKMDLAWLRKHVQKVDRSVADGMVGRIQQMNGMLDDSIQTVRKIAGQLRPALLDQLGLMAAMEWQAKEWESRTGITCCIDKQSGEPHFSHEQATQLFRIFQELLTNVARHAHATSVAVVLRRVGDEFSLDVRDDGRGIREEEIRRPLSLGIVGMKERATRIGGNVQFTGQPGGGTTVRVTFPIEQVVE